VLKVRIVLRQNTFDRCTNKFFSIERSCDDRNLHPKRKLALASPWLNFLGQRHKGEQKSIWKAGKSNEMPVPAFTPPVQSL
jgi:hypothetical protein